MKRESRWRRAGKPPARTYGLALAAFCLLLITGCGKKGPPLPPLRHGPERVTALACVQRGKQILLTGLLPDKSQDGGPLVPLREIRVFRLDRGGLAGPGITGRTGQ